MESKDSLLDSLTQSGHVKIGSDPHQRTQKNKPFPLVLEPAEGTDNSFVNLQQWMQKHHALVLKAASEYGAVMFSNFAVESGNEWASVLFNSSLKEFNYVGGAAVRKLIVGNEQRMNDMQILTTNESPPESPIPFHHELAQTNDPPAHICFYCKQNNAEGGSTPLIRSDFVFDWLSENHPAAAEKFEKLGVKYIKVAPEEDDPTSSLGRSWKSMFHKQTREEAEQVMKASDNTWEWLEDGCCKVISPVLPAVRVGSNGNKVFYNQVIAAYTGWNDKRNVSKKAVVYGDGSPMDDVAMTALNAWMEENACAYRWTPGKFVIVDNSMAYHSRQPFKGGKRVVYAAIAKGTKPVTETQTHLVLNSGDRMPMLGLGLWMMSLENCENAVYNSIKLGYRMLDSAEIYRNEKETGRGIQRALKEGICKREELFVVSKLWSTFHRPEQVRPAVMRSLKDLQVDYLDLYLVHYPIALKHANIEEIPANPWITKTNPNMEIDMDVTFQQTWEAMEELVREGLVRNIGVSNVGVLKLMDVYKFAKIKPAVIQNEMHPFLTQDRLVRYARSLGVQIQAYSSFGNLSQKKPGDLIFEQEPIKQAAAKYNKSPAQISLRWALQRGTIIMPKSERVERLQENMELFDFSLTDAEMKAITKLDRNCRFLDPAVFTDAANCFQPIYE